MKQRRVKITGIGPVTPAGIGREAFWRGILEPVSRVRPYTKIGPEWGEFVAASVEDAELRPHLEQMPGQKHAARHSLMAAAGASLALKDAGLSAADLRGLACGVVCGTAIMDFGAITRETESVFKRGLRGVQPRLVLVANVSQVAATVADALNLSSHNMTIQSSCCSGLDAVGHAAQMVAAGEVQMAICGGAESPLFKHPLIEFRAAGMTPSTTALAEKQDRPFDLWRTTGVVSEAACMMVLEPEESPRPGYCFISGYAFASDLAGQLCSGLEDSIRKALFNARLRPADCDVISAWGPGHKQVDAAEAAVLGRVFGPRVRSIAAYSIKGSVGNPLAAAPAMQIAAAALGLREGMLPPTVNYEYPDPACPLDLSNRARAVSHQVTIVDAHGVAGTNACLVLERCS